jgi:hypothetical protein
MRVENDSEMRPRDFEFERIDALMDAISSMASTPEEIIAALLRDFMRRREALQERRRGMVDDDQSWARLSQALVNMDLEIAKLKGAEATICESIFKQGDLKASLFEGRRGGWK